MSRIRVSNHQGTDIRQQSSFNMGVAKLLHLHNIAIAYQDWDTLQGLPSKGQRGTKRTGGELTKRKFDY